MSDYIQDALKDRVLVNADDKRRVLHLGAMNLVPPEVGIFDEPTRCYPVNQEWAAFIMGMVSWLAHPAVWRDADDLNYFAIGEINRFTIGMDCDMPFLLRQNSENPCLLEQSSNGGDTWSLAYDFSLCQPIGLDYATIDALSNELDRLRDLYDSNPDDISELHPNLVYDESGTDSIRDIALCAGIDALIDFICELVLQERENDAIFARIGAIILGVTSAILIASGIGSPLGLAIATALVGGYAVAWDGFSTLLLNDDEAKALVACCMYNSLRGDTIDKTAFENSLSGCDFDELTNEAQMAGAIAPMLTEDDIYTTFLDFVDGKFRPAQLGLVDCDCEDTWTHSWLSTHGDLVPDGWTVVYGFYDAMNDRYTEEASMGSSDFVWLEYIVPSGKFATITAFRMDYHVQSPANRTQVVRINDEADSIIEQHDVVVNGTADSTLILVTPTAIEPDYKLLFIANCANNAGPHFANVKLITVTGTGDDIFT